MSGDQSSSHKNPSARADADRLAREARAGGAKSQPDTNRGVAGDLVGRLEEEWPALAAGPLTDGLRLWSRRQPALAIFATPQQLLSRLRSLRGQPRAEDAILAALLVEARSDPRAARLVLHALLPGLKTLARRLLFEASERDELWSALLAHCWERIRRYPLERRPTRIAANLLLDTLKRTTFELKRNRRDRDLLTTADEHGAQPALPVAAAANVEQLLARAVAAAAIRADEAQLILHTRIDGAELHTLAAAAGIAYHTLLVRRLRAEKRLLVFLGHPAVTFRGRTRPLCSARVVGAGDTGSAGRGAATTHQTRR